MLASIVTCDGAFRICDSHGKYLYCNSHPQGTSALLEVPSISCLFQHIQSLYQISDIFELRGVKIAKVNLDIAGKNTFVLVSGALHWHYIHCVILSLKPCSYWDCNTLLLL